MVEFKLSKRSKGNLKGVDKRIIKLIERVIKKSTHDFGIPNEGGFRTAQEQNNLFHKRPKVTNLDGFKNKSYHQSGMAFDIFVYDEHGACWECIDKYLDIINVFKEEFEQMKHGECLFEENEFFESGSDWRWKDYPHMQVVKK